MANDRAAAIREAAVRLFSEQGYDATSIRDIAREVGLLPGSLYAHITSKEQLLLEIIEDGVEEFLSAATGADSVGPAPQRLRQAIAAHLEVIASARDRTGVVFHQWRSLTGEDRRRVLRKRAAYEQHFVDVLDAGVLEGSFHAHLDTRFAVLVILGALNWAPEWFSPTGDRTADEIADRFSDLLLGGLGVPGRVAPPVAQPGT